MNPAAVFDRTMDILQLIVLIGSVVALLRTLAATAKAPEQTQNNRLDAVEKRLDKVEERLEDGNQHFASLDDGSTITQQCILAMMDAQISGDNVDELKKQRTSLYDYLSKKGVK